MKTAPHKIAISTASVSLVALAASGQPRSSLRRTLHLLSLLMPPAFLLVALLRWFNMARAEGVDTLVRRADFVSTLTGARVLADGNGVRLYDLYVQHAAQVQVFAPCIKLGPADLLPYNHLPFEALLVTPLLAMGLSYPAIFACWSVLMLAALVTSFYVLQRALPVHGAALPVLGLALVSYPPVIRSFMLGQNSPLVLLGLCLTFALSRRRMDGYAGVSLLLVALKPQILPVILLMLVLQWRPKALISFVGSLAALSLALMPLLGVEWPLQYARLLVGVAGWQDSGAIAPAIMQNWRGFFTDTVGAWAPGLVTPLFLLFSLASASVLVFAWYSVRLGNKVEPKAAADPRYDMLWAIAGIVAVLTSLHLNPHDLTLLLLPAWILASYALSSTQLKSRVWLYLLWGGYALMQVASNLENAVGNSAVSVVPNVLLMAAGVLLLAWQLSRRSTVRVSATLQP